MGITIAQWMKTVLALIHLSWCETISRSDCKLTASNVCRELAQSSSYQFSIILHRIPPAVLFYYPFKFNAIVRIYLYPPPPAGPAAACDRDLGSKVFNVVLLVFYWFRLERRRYWMLISPLSCLPTSPTEGCGGVHRWRWPASAWLWCPSSCRRHSDVSHIQPSRTSQKPVHH